MNCDILLDSAYCSLVAMSLKIEGLQPQNWTLPIFAHRPRWLARPGQFDAQK